MDVDIDFVDREVLLKLIDYIPAAIKRDGQLVKHNTGIYFQDIPYNPLTTTASLDHHEAESRGYFKIDFLNVSAYTGVQDEQHLIRLMNADPVWELLETKEICDKLFHINGHHDLVNLLKPRSIIELASVLSLIRPGRRHLVDQCAKFGFNHIQSELWNRSNDSGYAFKKSHAVAYSHLIVVQLNLLCEQSST
jgi:DNA polymerase III alpha subunit